MDWLTRTDHLLLENERLASRLDQELNRRLVAENRFKRACRDNEDLRYEIKEILRRGFPPPNSDSPTYPSH